MIKTIKHIISLFAVTSILALSFMGCEQPTTPEKETTPEVKDTVAPAEVSDLKAVTGDKKVTLSWQAPADDDFAKVVITYGDKTVEVAKGTTTKDIIDLTNGTKYDFKIRTADTTSNKSIGVTISQYPMNPLTETPTNVDSVIIPIPGKEPTETKTYDIVKFGDWPQSLKDANVQLSSNTTTVNGWTCYYGSDGAYYVKVVATPDEDSTTEFKNGETYYFKLEPIQWRVLTNDYEIPDGKNEDGTNKYKSSGKKLLFAEKALAAHEYHATSNKYDTSDIRTYLNNDFINKAFTQAEIAKIPETNVDNSWQSTFGTGEESESYYKEHNYACENTKDKIFLLSEKEITTADYGFDAYNKYVGDGTTTTSTRIRKTTDYARATGAASITKPELKLENSSSFWLRSPIYNRSNIARDVSLEGNALNRDSVSRTSLSVVPALSMTF